MSDVVLSTVSVDTNYIKAESSDPGALVKKIYLYVRSINRIDGPRPARVGRVKSYNKSSISIDAYVLLPGIMSVKNTFIDQALNNKIKTHNHFLSTKHT